MNAIGTELSPKQHQAVQALLVHPNVAVAAKSVGVGVRTLYRWLDAPEFRLALNGAFDKAIDAAARGLVRLTDKAIRVTETVLDDPDSHPSTRLRAAEIGLRSGYVQKGVTSMHELLLRSMILAAIWMTSAD